MTARTLPGLERLMSTCNHQGLGFARNRRDIIRPLQVRGWPVMHWTRYSQLCTHGWGRPCLRPVQRGSSSSVSMTM